MFTIFRNHPPALDTKKIIGDVLTSFLLRNELMPVYDPSIKSQQEADDICTVLPLVCLWGEDRKAGTSHLFINGTIVFMRLERLVPRTHPQFAGIRNQIMEETARAAQAAIAEVSKVSAGIPLSVIFSRGAARLDPPANRLKQAAAG